ncbi:MAG: export transporter permease LptF [Pseudomonadota bacterium]
MLFDSSIRRELGRSFGATLLVLVTIVITMLLIRTLGLANRGSVNPQEIMLVLTYTVLGRLPTVLTLALFIAVVSVLSRMYRESEMVIWQTSGQGLMSLLKPVFRFAWPVLAMIGLLVLLVWPWANEQTDQLRERFERRGDLERVSPGQFQESSAGRRVFFVDKDSEGSKEGRNVFVSEAMKDGSEIITSARSGRVQWVDDAPVLLLERGQRVQQAAGAGTTQISEFEEYGIQVDNTSNKSMGGGSLKSLPTWELLRNPSMANQGELGWRLGMAWTAINFILLAVATTTGNPRAGRSGNQAFMLFAFVFYYNFLNLGQTWVTGGLFGLVPFMAALHGSAMVLAVAWLYLRHHNLHLGLRFRLRGTKGAA